MSIKPSLIRIRWCKKEREEEKRKISRRFTSISSNQGERRISTPLHSFSCRRSSQIPLPRGKGARPTDNSTLFLLGKKKKGSQLAITVTGREKKEEGGLRPAIQYPRGKEGKVRFPLYCHLISPPNGCTRTFFLRSPGGEKKGGGEGGARSLLLHSGPGEEKGRKKDAD